MKFSTNGKAILVSLCILLCNINLTFGQVPGANMTSPINAGILYFGNTFSSTQNNNPSNGFGNNIGQSSDDIYYRFTLTYPGTVNISHCASGIDTYMHILDQYGNNILSIDDNGPLCPSLQASATLQLGKGTYFVVSEGYSSTYGDIKTEITLITPSVVGANIYNAIDAGTIDPGVSFSDAQNNSTSNNFGNNYGQISDDIYYKFTLSSMQDVELSSCGSNFDTYMHLLDANGNLLERNDDAGPLCQTLQASIKRSLPVGVYYVVIEGYEDNSGDVLISIKNAIPEGANIQTAIDAGIISSGANFYDVKDNSPANGYLNDIGQPSDDIYHKFQLIENTEVSISHCGSNFNTYAHLLDASGNTIATNDDNGPLCQTQQASIKVQLLPGTYYLVSEGAGSSSGNINISISSPGELLANSCGTVERDSIEFENLPYYDNNDYLENFLDSIGYDNNVVSKGSASVLAYTSNSTRYRIPIKFYVIRDNNGMGGATDLDIRNLMQRLNQTYAQNYTGIQFYMKCEPEYINNSDYLTLSDKEARHLGRTKEDPHGIDVFLTNSLNDASGSYQYSFFISFDPFRAVFLSRQAYSNPIRNTFAHEIGHYLGLDHTHQFNDKGRCRKEPIDRNRRYAGISFCKPLGSRIMCESTGDALRDTPADPDLSDNTDCVYQDKGKNDHFGDSYFSPPGGSFQPIPTNIMSYNGLSSCRSQFTRLQIAVMLSNIEGSSLKGLWSDSKYDFDTFEPDNSKEATSTILLGEKQDRNFNYQPSFNSSTSSCDVDWVSYYSTLTGNVEIATAQVSGKTPAANTILSLCDNNGNVLVTNDDQSGTNTFSKLNYNLNSGTTYLIKVENKNNAENGYYSLTVGCNLSGIQINSSADACTGDGSYFIAPQNLPSGSQVYWGISGDFSFLGSSTGNTVSIQNNSSGTGTLTATVISECSAPYTIYKNIGTSAPAAPIISGIPFYYFEAFQEYNLSIQNYNYDYNYLWEFSGVADYLDPESDHNGRVISFGIYNDGYFTIKLTITDNCGNTTVWEEGYTTGNSVSKAIPYNIYPNPVNNEIIIEGLNENTGEFNAKKAFGSNSLINLYNDKGKVLKTEKIKAGESSVKFDVSDIPNGNYFIHIQNGKHLVKKQIIVQH